MGLRRKKKEREQAHPYCAAVVPAAGLGTRMGGEDKVLLTLGGVPVLARTLRALDNCPLIDELIVVTREELIVPVGRLCQEYAYAKVRKVVLGGESRTASVLAGICEVSRETALIAIHDGARPLVSPSVLEQVLQKGAETGAAAPAVPLKDTVKRAENGIVRETPARESLFAVQTPQVFEAGLIKAALTRALEDGAPLTDDCAAVERLGMTVHLTAGDERNIKITTPVDLAVGTALLDWEEDA
ncbi:MAG: 2-C-methyl-D-erythritol 4-phosphate cytidylyltransferase [Oscillospiraceae bacterium]|nr:2-C-methyl-D-erythritol 4-phosphate cytidylyltransferase [Oscillospiraceae bacterium]